MFRSIFSEIHEPFCVITFLGCALDTHRFCITFSSHLKGLAPALCVFKYFRLTLMEIFNVVLLSKGNTMVRCSVVINM